MTDRTIKVNGHEYDLSKVRADAYDVAVNAEHTEHERGLAFFVVALADEVIALRRIVPEEKR